MSGLANFIWWLRGVCGFRLDAPVDILTWDDEHTLVCDDGSLLSLIDVTGCDVLLSLGTAEAKEEFEEAVNRLADAFNVGANQVGHIVQVVWERNADLASVEQAIEGYSLGIRNACRRAGLSLDGLISSDASALAKESVSEHLTLAIWTVPTLLPVAERKASDVERLKVRASALAPERQVESTMLALRSAHASARDTLVRKLTQQRLAVMPIEAACRRIKASTSPETVASNWRPALLPHSNRVTQSKSNGNNLQFIAPATLSWQLVDGSAEHVDMRTIRVGNRLYQACDVEIPPDHDVTPEQLIQAIDAQGIRTNFRMSWHVSAGAGKSVGPMIRKALSAFSFGEPHVKRAYNDIKNDADEKRVGLQMSLSTWVSGDVTPANLATLRAQNARLMRGVNSWGSGQATDMVGHNLRSVFVTVPGANRVNATTVLVPPLRDAVALLPMNRPGSPWSDGPMLFRTPDGRLYPYDPLSPLQASWIVQFVAPMGGGKSSLANTINLACVMSPNQDDMAYVSCIDIGIASSGFISLVRESLPLDRRDEAVFVTLRPDGKQVMNPLDTGILGARWPTGARLQWLGRILKLICSQESNGRFFLPDRAGDFIDELVSFAYRSFVHGERSVRRFERGVIPEVDAALGEVLGSIGPTESWWTIVDALHAMSTETGYAVEYRDHLRALAQRAQWLAVPRLADLAALCSSGAMRDRFEARIEHTGESVDEFVRVSILRAEKMFPYLWGPTTFAIDARIISLNIEHLVPKSISTKEASVAYMIARELIAGKFFMHVEDVRALCGSIRHEPSEPDDVYTRMRLPSQYWDEHIRIAERMGAALKVLSMDELHRLRGVDLVWKQIAEDGRESRARKLRIQLMSQLIDDIPAEMSRIIGTVFVAAGSGSDKMSRKLLDDWCSIGAAAHEALRSFPKASFTGGAHYLLSAISDRGRICHHVVLNMSPEKLWALTTQADDRALRDMLYGLVGASVARQLLVKRFGSGSALEEIKRRRQQRGGESEDLTPIEELAKELAASL